MVLENPRKWQNALDRLPQKTVLSEEDFDTLLEKHLTGLGKVQRNRIKEASALAYYHQQNQWPIIKTLICNEEMARKLKLEFELIFSSTPSGYQELDLRKELTRGKMTELLLVLEHPELPLHNNPAELAARTMVQRRNISYGTQTELETKAWDRFISLVDTTRKLGISFFEYVAGSYF